MPAKKITTPAVAATAAPTPAAPIREGRVLPELHQDMEEFIDGLGLRHFTGREMTEYWTRTFEGVRNDCPAESLWPNIVPTLVVADQIRHELGLPLTINSSYRSPRYNRAVGGEPNSFHMRFMALDISARCSTERLHIAASDMRGRTFRLPGNAGTFVFAGGIGLYVRSGFVHIDCRKTPANWKGN